MKKAIILISILLNLVFIVYIGYYKYFDSKTNELNKEISRWVSTDIPMFRNELLPIALVDSNYSIPIKNDSNWNFVTYPYEYLGIEMRDNRFEVKRYQIYNPNKINKSKSQKNDSLSNVSIEIEKFTGEILFIECTFPWMYMRKGYNYIFMTKLVKNPYGILIFWRNKDKFNEDTPDKNWQIRPNKIDETTNELYTNLTLEQIKQIYPKFKGKYVSLKDEENGIKLDSIHIKNQEYWYEKFGFDQTPSDRRFYAFPKLIFKDEKYNSDSFTW
jgi:hypothetical protein